MKINKKELLTLYDFIDTIEEVRDEDVKLKISTDWEVDTTDNIIYIGDKQKTQLDDYFIEYLKTDKYNYFIISLLHEVRTYCYINWRTWRRPGKNALNL